MNEPDQMYNLFEPFVDEGLSLLRKAVLVPEYPTVDNHYSLQEMIWQALSAQGMAASIASSSEILNDPKTLRRLSELMEIKPEVMTITLFGNQVIAVEAGNTANELFGVAFDIGTTTVVGMLVDINTKKVIAVCSKTNPQVSLGADVISRIQATHELLGGLEGLSQLIRQCLNRILEELCAAAGISPNYIYATTVAGNATMVHLFLEISPSTLVRKPYTALFKHMAPLCPAEVELAVNPAGKVVVLPNIASFIGSDTTAAVLAVDQDVSTVPMLLVDLGTNCEMVLTDGDKLYACSTAAGPAFEGAHIRDGMRAAAGAITGVTITDDVQVEVIGDTKPTGICGSGIVKAIAELIKAGIVGPAGRINRSTAQMLPPNLERRLKRKDNQWEFVLVEAKDSATGADISVTQADIRQIQLVKSSICTGIQFLLDRTPIQKELQVCLAGAFGNDFDVDSAIIIGMLPGFKRDSIRPVGNAAGTGAIKALLFADKLQRCNCIADKVDYVELAAQPNFQNKFLANLSFPVVKRDLASGGVFTPSEV